jgi:hypothetical protein
VVHLSRLIQHGRYWDASSTSPPNSLRIFCHCALLGAFALYLELSDSFVGESIVKEGGFAYLGGCGIAILAGIGMPLLGAFAGTNRVQQSAAAWRWSSGVSGAVLLGLTLFMGSGFVKTVYYDYVFYPKEKAGEGYIMPLRSQDIVAELSIACILIGLLLLSTYLLRSAFRRQKNTEIAVNP